MSDTSDVGGKPQRRGRALLVAGLAMMPLALAVRTVAFASPQAVERFYSQGLYPWIAGALTAVTGWLPFSVAEAGIVALVGVLVLAGWRGIRSGGWRNRPLRTAGRSAFAAWFVAGVLLLAFDLSWGLNYARPSLAARLELDVELPRVDEIRAMATTAAAGATRLHQALGASDAAPTRSPWSIAQLDELVDAAYAAVSLPGDRFGAHTAPAKALAISPLMSRLGIAGIYMPFTAEPSINGGVPDATLPLAVAHEKAHHRGITNEGEANLSAIMACLAAEDPYLRYAAHLEVAGRLVGALGQVDPEGAAATWELLGPGPRADIEAIREYWARYRGLGTRVARRVNDAYLRSNRVPEGVRSYGQVTDLLVALERSGRLGLDAGR